MLLSVGFIMLCRLSLPSATKQLLIVAAGSAVSLVIPVMIRKNEIFKGSYMGLCRNWYCTSGGSSCSGKHKLRCKAFSYGNPAFRGDQDNLRIFMASLLCTKVDFRKVVLATIVAVIHVGILVLSRDLGSAVIFLSPTLY